MDYAHMMIAAFCPRCGGWTMIVPLDSPNAKEWTRQCYVIGELIMKVRDTSPLGPACPDVDNLPDDRTCA